MDEFGRLPDDVLKYISFLGARPTIAFHGRDLVISSPFYKQMYPILDGYYSQEDKNELLDNINDFIQHASFLQVMIRNLSCADDVFTIEVSIDCILLDFNGDSTTELPLCLLPQIKQSLLTLYHTVESM